MTEQTELTAAKVAKGSIYLTLETVLITLISVTGFAVMARMITLTEMGVIAGLTLFSTFAIIISDFGLSATVLKYVSELRGKQEDLSQIVFSTTTLKAIIVLFTASILFIIAPYLSELLFETTLYSNTIRLLILDVVVIAIAHFFRHVLLGANKLKQIAFYGTISILARWVFIVGFLMAGLGINGIVLGWLIGDLVLLATLTPQVARLADFTKQSLKPTKQGYLPLLRFAFPLFLASAVMFLYTWYDQALILAFMPSSDLGIYNTAYRVFSVLVSVAIAMGLALLPYYGMAHGRNDHKAISYGITRASKYTMLLIFPLSLGLMALSRPVLTLFAGQQYEQGWSILATLSLFGLVYGILPAISNILLVSGKTKTIFLLSIIPVLISLLLIPLIWSLDLVGLALMRGAALLFTLILTVYFTNKIAKISLNKKTLTTTLIASATMAATLIILQQLVYSTALLPLYVAIGAAIYLIIIRVSKIINSQDYQLLKQVIGEKPAKTLMKLVGFSYITK